MYGLLTIRDVQGKHWESGDGSQSRNKQKEHCV